MTTRAEDQRTAMQEALEMLQKGRPADAMETLSAALEAPTDDASARDAALAEVRAVLIHDFGVDLDATGEACPICRCPPHVDPCPSTSPRTGRRCPCAARGPEAP